MAEKHLAVGGPLSASYLDADQAHAAGYELGEWSTGETVWTLSSGPYDQEQDGDTL